MAGLLAAVGCAGDTAAVREARRVRDRWVGESPDHRRFDIEISRGSTDPVRREQLVQAIADEQFAIAALALETLGAAPPAEARDALRQVFERKSGVLKLRAAVALGRLGDGAAIEFLRAEVGDPAESLNPDAVAVVAAADGGQDAVRRALTPRLESADQATRDEAYAALGGVRAPWATDLLLQGLEREHGEARHEAIHALGRTGDPRVTAAIGRFVNTRGLVFATLEALGAVGDPAGADVVRPMLASPEPIVQAYAAVALWRLGAKDEAAPVVAAAVEKGDASVRAVLAEQLAPLDDPDARRHLGRLATDAERAVRIAALRSIAIDPGPGDEPALLAAAGDADYQIQSIALAALAKAGTPGAIATIRPLLEADNPYVALAAAHAVVEIAARTGTT
jgi:HEAT repeat protein